MYIIFLDIDGVLNSNGMECQPDSSLLNEQCIERLQRIVGETNSKIVLHSGWRFWFCDKMRPTTSEANLLTDMLRNHGITLYDKTPDLSSDEIKRSRKFSLIKAEEILLWLSGKSDVENYIVLEDLELHNSEVKSHQIKTDGSKGLTDTDVEKAILMLKP